MEEVVIQKAPPQGKRLSKEERSKVMSDAAKRRWAKARKAKVAAKTPKVAPKAASKAPVVKRKAPAPREFSSALRTAERRLASAILERSKAAATYAVLSAEIPSLQRIILALKNPIGVLPEYGIDVAPSLERIVGDEPLPYRNPPRIAPQPELVPQQLHPANSMGRAAGGAIGVELAEPEDEDHFLKESAVGGGQWV